MSLASSQRNYNKLISQRDEELEQLKKDLAEYKTRCNEQEVKIILSDKQ